MDAEENPNDEEGEQAVGKEETEEAEKPAEDQEETEVLDDGTYPQTINS